MGNDAFAARMIWQLVMIIVYLLQEGVDNGDLLLECFGNVESIIRY